MPNSYFFPSGVHNPETAVIVCTPTNDTMSSSAQPAAAPKPEKEKTGIGRVFSKVKTAWRSGSKRQQAAAASPAAAPKGGVTAVPVTVQVTKADVTSKPYV